MSTTAKTAGSLVEPYLAERLARHELGSDSAKNTRSALRRFVLVVDDVSVRRVSRADVERWLETRDAKSAATRRHELSTVRAFCGWLVRRGHLAADPTVEMPKVRVPRYLPRALPADRVTRLLTAAPDACGRLICPLMVQEGLRCAEVSRLQVGDVDFLARSARIIGKGGHERVLPVSPETWSALDAYLSEHPATSGPLVRSYKREWKALNADHISGLVSEWMSRAGIKRYNREGDRGRRGHRRHHAGALQGHGGARRWYRSPAGGGLRTNRRAGGLPAPDAPGR
jgi:site-specific recombinase XerD